MFIALMITRGAFDEGLPRPDLLFGSTAPLHRGQTHTVCTVARRTTLIRSPTRLLPIECKLRERDYFLSFRSANFTERFLEFTSFISSLNRAQGRCLVN